MPTQTITAPPSEALADAAGEVAPDAAMLVLDRDLRIVAADGGALRDGGWAARIVGRALADLLPHRAYAAVAARYRLALEGRPVLFDHVAGDDRAIYRVQALPLPDDGGPGRLVAFVRAVPRDDRLAATG